jgi:hypothetical protein
MEGFPFLIASLGEKEREISGGAVEPPAGGIALLFGPGQNKKPDGTQMNADFQDAYKSNPP